MKAIEFENVGKQYRLGLVSTGTFSHDLNRWWVMNVLGKDDPYLKIGETNDRSHKGNSDFVWALKDISFSVEQGDVVGIIGKNGAGKSTLLKLLSKVTAPTTGEIRVNGRISSLLEVGTGFHPEMTGRENIFMNGAIMGMTKAEVKQKFDEIVDFSGCERYIDTPVKRYSSGMKVRLGFAVAAHLDPEILVVDEVLAVGDAEFQKKAIGKMQDVSKGGGRTVLFVSHNMASIRTLCKKGVLLDNGYINTVGPVDDVVDYYIKSSSDDLTCKKLVITNSNRDTNRTLDVHFISFEFVNEKPVFASDEDIDIRIIVKARRTVNECRINSSLYNIEGMAVGCASSNDFFSIVEGETKEMIYKIKAINLVAGIYSLSFSVGTGNVFTSETNFDVVQKVLKFEIDRYRKDSNLFFSKWNKKWGGNIYIETKTTIL